MNEVSLIQQLNANVTTWFNDRGLLTNGQPIAQFSKLVEEFGEMVKEIKNDDLNAARMELGDCMVVINGLCNQLNVDPNRIIVDSKPDLKHFMFDHYSSTLIVLADLGEIINKQRDATVALSNVYDVIIRFTLALSTTPGECYALAYDKIKDRKGTNKNGIYIKSDDMGYGHPSSGL